MLTTVEVLTAQGDTLTLPLQDSSAGYLIKNIDGLDPVKATIVSSSFAQLDGTQYQSSHRENRNLVLKLGIEANYVTTTVQSLRSGLYRYFMPKSFVQLKFYIDGVYFATIDGRVESCETPLFTKEPELLVSIVCFNPDFVAPSSVVVSGSTVATTTEQVVNYPGTVEAGFIFRMTLNRALTEFTIYNRAIGAEFLAFEFSAILQSGDILEISTIPRSKYAQLTRGGTQSSILYGVSPAANWLSLMPGVNNVRVLATGAAIPFTIEYTAKYGGL